MLDDFNVPKYDWLNGTLLCNCHYYNKIKGNLIHATTCFLGLNQYNNSVPNSALIDTVFTYTTFVFLCHIILWSVLIIFIPPVNLGFKLTFDSQRTSLTPGRNYGQGD
jgi:hypothetical protein